MHRKSVVLLVILALMLLAATPQAGLAQTQPLTCPAIVEQALTQVAANCARQGRNTVCYGFPRVAATFAETVAADFFTRPADRADLAALQTLQTFPLDTDTGDWGIALLKAQANVPETLPGQAVTFVLMGDTEIENAVETNAGAQPVTVIAQSETSAYRAPGGEPLTTITAGTVLEALEVSVDSGWLRVRVGDSTGWIQRDTVSQNPRIEELPTSGQPRFTPMQAFYLRSAPGELQCREAPSVLAVQSPQGITVDLVANGANIRLGSLILLQILPPGDVLKLTTLEGQAVLEPDTLNEVVVPAGMTTTRCLDEPDDLGLDGQANDRSVGLDCLWQPPAPVTPEEQAENAIIQRILNRLEPQAEVADCPTGTTTTHVIQPGETLFRIALRYRTTVATVAAANNIADPQTIYAGQRLTIPCGIDTGIPSRPPTPAPVPATLVPVTLIPPVATLVPPVVSGVDCSTFVPTSPLDGLPYGRGTFYWNPARGAAGYRLNIYNEDERKGMLVASLASEGTSTQLTADLTINAIGYGFRFSWEVLAFTADGVLACKTARVVVPRAAPPRDEAPPATPEATP